MLLIDRRQGSPARERWDKADYFTVPCGRGSEPEANHEAEGSRAAGLKNGREAAGGAAGA
jgi:hypothetical protein